MKKTTIIGTVLALMPAVAFAQTYQVESVGGLLSALTDMINLVIPFLIALAVLFFIYYLVKFILNAGDPEAQKEARSYMLWAVIALFVIVSIWGLVNILVGTFSFQDGIPTLPDIPEA